MRKSIIEASPRAAPETCGCMWTMSVPRATWTVQGMPARWHAATRLISACGQRRSAMYWPSAAPRPRSCFEPRSAEMANASAVSRAMPNRPACSCAPTSSLVLPARASSKSWIAAEPFIEIESMMPRSMRSIRYGAQPVLMTCPPIAAATVRPSRWARTKWSRSLRSSFAASCLGSESSQSPMAVVGATGRPRSETPTLLGREARSYVRSPLRSNGRMVLVIRCSWEPNVAALR